MIKTILKYQDRLLKNQNITYKRYLYEKINFDDKMVAILGARGVGKTVLLLHKLQELKNNNNKKAIYISLDYYGYLDFCTDKKGKLTNRGTWL